MRSSRKGGALLAVLWLAAALSAIAYSVATTVRGEVERAETSRDALRAHFLASGAVQRALLYMQWGPATATAEGASPYFSPGQPYLRLSFPGGDAFVEVIPETARLDVNRISGEELLNLLLVLGLNPHMAMEVGAGILDWRNPVEPGSGMLDAWYLSRTPSFLPAHASFQQIEELLLVRGVTPELYYGRYDRTPDGGLVARPGLRDCLTVYGALTPLDINSASPAVMQALGVPPQGVAAIVERRIAAPFRPGQMGDLALLAGPAASRFGIGAGPYFTIRATARPRRPDGGLAETRRSAAATVRFLDLGAAQPYHIVRWQEGPAAGQPAFDPWPR